jgi:iron only hydrogenase large subunit-like protein
LEEIKSGKKSFDLLEVMACPEGCTNGGGQPLPVDEQMIRTRSKAIYEMDNSANLHAAHRDQNVQEYYASKLGGPGSKIASDLIFTSYTKREVML